MEDKINKDAEIKMGSEAESSSELDNDMLEPSKHTLKDIKAIVTSGSKQGRRKVWKILIIVVLVLLLLYTALIIFVNIRKDPAVGTWRSYAIIDEDVTNTSAYTLVINSDGSYSIAVYGEERFSGYWTRAGRNNESDEYDEVLALYKGDNPLVFGTAYLSKEKEEKELSVLVGTTVVIYKLSE